MANDQDNNRAPTECKYFDKLNLYETVVSIRNKIKTLVVTNTKYNTVG